MEAKDVAAKASFAQFLSLLKTAEKVKDAECHLLAKVCEWAKDHVSCSSAPKVSNFFMIFQCMDW